MVWAGLALAGAPWSSGAFAKHDAKYAVAELPVLVPLAVLLLVLLTAEGWWT